MKWLVFGGTGRLGRLLLPLLNDAISFGSDDLDLVAVSAKDLQAEIRQMASDAEGAFGVVNLAAAADVPRCETDKVWASQLNALAPGKIARACSAMGLPLVHISTDYVFGGQSAPYKPFNPPSPTCHYGATKAQGEVAVLRYPCSFVARMSFIPEPTGYGWVAEDARVTKEFADDAARRLAVYLGTVALRWTSDETCHWNRIVHLVPHVETTLADLVHTRYPDLPTVSRAEAQQLIPYRFPWDVRLSGAWVAP